MFRGQRANAPDARSVDLFRTTEQEQSQNLLLLVCMYAMFLREQKGGIGSGRADVSDKILPLLDLSKA
jgi:hypothetical protein